MFNENISRDIRALAHEKAIDVERVFEALEDALSTAAKKYYKTREPIEAILDSFDRHLRGRRQCPAPAGRFPHNPARSSQALRHCRPRCSAAAA